MHMSDALLSPAVGAGFTAASAAMVGYSVRKISKGNYDEKKIPMMGVMGAFVFVAQMINFTIPGTGSSGHIGGGILLAALIGPFHALLTYACVLLIQCLFFADGGLLAYGCNVFNLGICTCLIAYKYIFEPIVRRNMNKRIITISSVLAVTVGLQLGAFFVCIETFLSGVTELPLGAFLALMLPVHLATGLIEGLVTAAVLSYVYDTRPELLVHDGKPTDNTYASASVKKILVVFLVLTVIIGGVISQFASGKPDGLEWSIERITGKPEIERGGKTHEALGAAVENTAAMPDYAFRGDDNHRLSGSVAGITGSVITIITACGIGFIITGVKKKREKYTDKNL